MASICLGLNVLNSPSKKLEAPPQVWAHTSTKDVFIIINDINISKELEQNFINYCVDKPLSQQVHISN